MELTITIAGFDELDEVAALWQELQAYEAANAPPGYEPLPAEVSWRRRRANYETWLADDEGILVLARDGGRLVGYAFLRFGPADDMWVTADAIAELTSLIVTEERRGHGVGAALLDEIDAQRGLRGADIEVGTMVTNERAIAAYLKRGWSRRRIILSSFSA